MTKRLFNLATLLVAFVLVAATTPETSHSIPVNTADSKVYWTGYKVTGQHAGTINIKSGELDYHGGQLKGGKFAIDMTSVNVTDLKAGAGKEKLEGHLSSDDFFGVTNHPTASFTTTKVTPKGTPGDYKVVGNLTIKNITKEVRFYAKVKEDGGRIMATADITIDRSDFDIRYGSGSFFDNLGDKTIYDEFELKVELVAGN